MKQVFLTISPQISSLAELSNKTEENRPISFIRSCTLDGKTKTIATNMTNYFPFEISDHAGQFTISAETEAPELDPTYTNLFEKYDYSGNGYCWEGHIVQILEQIDPELLQHIDFDPEAGGFYAYADTKENQIRFVEVLSPIFSDMVKLEDYIKKANRPRIDD